MTCNYTCCHTSNNYGYYLHHHQGCIEPQSGERACNSWIAKCLLLLKLKVTPTNCRRREKRAVANDETTVPPTPKVLLVPHAIFSVFVDTHLDTTIHCCCLFSSKRKLGGGRLLRQFLRLIAVQTFTCSSICKRMCHFLWYLAMSNRPAYCEQKRTRVPCSNGMISFISAGMLAIATSQYTSVNDLM